ncbi:MAG: hypothetical protein KJ072_00505 [Verrucomicrobia bacterium]|nr:hypothetical protein [Verrucomicrobiota bacterium]
MLKERSWRAAVMGAAVFGLVLLLAGCASTPKVDWDSRVGGYVFDQAVLDMGPPERSSELSDGTKVAEWFLKPGSTMSFGVGTGYYGRGGGVGVGQSVSSGRSGQYLRLTFDAKGVLTRWEKVWR